MSIAVYINPKLHDVVCLQQKITELLTRERMQFSFVTERDCLAFANVLIVVGGDGSILKMAKSAIENNVKILPINAGNVGFLAEFEKEELQKAIQFLKDGVFILNSRPLLFCSIENKEYFAVNEFVLHANFLQQQHQERDSSKVIFANISIDGHKVTKIMASGVLISTPTGSTAYALSAGGNILMPDVPAFLFTPIAASTLATRPIVYSNRSILTVELTQKSAEGVLLCDGVPIANIQKGAKVHLQKATKSICFLRKDTNSFLDKLHKKS